MKILKNKLNYQVEVLLVEGDRFLSKVIANKLIRLGFNVSLANDGEEALDKIMTNSYGLVLLDLELRKKNGFEVLDHLKKTKLLKKNKIVAFLNMEKTSEISRLKKIGIIDYIVKGDLSIDLVVDKIKKFV